MNDVIYSHKEIYHCEHNLMVQPQIILNNWQNYRKIYRSISSAKNLNSSFSEAEGTRKIKVSRGDFWIQLWNVKKLGSCHSQSYKKRLTQIHQWLFLDPSGNWNWRVTCHHKIYRERQTQKATADSDLSGAETIGA